jgi:Cytidylate kinase
MDAKRPLVPHQSVTTGDKYTAGAGVNLGVSRGLARIHFRLRARLPTVRRVPGVSVEEILAEVMLREPINATRIVAIDGPSGSGKSALGHRLAQHIAAPLIQIDDFVSWSDFAGWWSRFDAQVLTPLLNQQAAHYQVRDWDNDEFGASLNGWKTVGWAPLVIIEGVTSARAEAADRISYAIWVEASDAVRLERGIARDGETHRQLWLDWMAAERAFFAADGTSSRADLRISCD